MTDEQLLEALAALRDGTRVGLRDGLPADEVLRRVAAARVFDRAWLAVLDHLTPAQRRQSWAQAVAELEPGPRQAIVDLVVLASHEVALPIAGPDA